MIFLSTENPSEARCVFSSGAIDGPCDGLVWPRCLWGLTESCVPICSFSCWGQIKEKESQGGRKKRPGPRDPHPSANSAADSTASSVSRGMVGQRECSFLFFLGPAASFFVCRVWPELPTPPPLFHCQDPYGSVPSGPKCRRISTPPQPQTTPLQPQPALHTQTPPALAGRTAEACLRMKWSGIERVCVSRAHCGLWSGCFDRRSESRWQSGYP